MNLETSVAIETINARLEALSLAVAWLIAQQPDQSGCLYLCEEANLHEERQDESGVVAELDILIGYVSSLIDQQQQPVSPQQEPLPVRNRGKRFSCGLDTVNNDS